MSHIIPEMYWINLTEICENRCLGCYEENIREQEVQKIMKKDIALTIVEGMSKVGATDCILIGGEPTLHPDILEIIAFAKERGQKVFIVTNGRSFSNEQFAVEVGALDVDLVQLSVYGWDVESYDHYTRTKGGFIEMVNGMENLKKHDVSHGVSYLLSKYIVPHLESAIAFAADREYKFIEFNIGAPCISPEEVNGSFAVPMEDQSTVVMQAYQACFAHDIEAGFNLTTPHCLFAQKDLQDLFVHASISSGCAMKTGSGVVFRVDGSITLCNHFKSFEVLSSLETVKLFKENHFVDFWNGSELSEVRGQSNFYTDDICSECSHWKKCGGGCMVSWSYFDPANYNLKPISI